MRVLTESESIDATLTLSRSLHSIGAQRLLHAKIDWERLFSSANPPGAVSPSVAKSTLTRDSRRRWELARIARRSGRTDLFRALLRNGS